MIPYVVAPALSLGPITIHAFGVLVVCAILVGGRVLELRAAQTGISRDEVSRFVTWILAGGFIGAHLVDRFVYFPGETLRDPLSILRIWSGISSFGGFLGGTLGGLWFFRRYAKPDSAWNYVEGFAYAFPFGWIFGRLGCAIAYDHPGAPTHLFLGEVFSDGIVRHNLGFEEALYTMVIATVFFVLGRKPRPRGFFLGLFLLLYAPFRFAVDFLRLVDVRYLGLTPGQYGCIVFFLAGVGILLAKPSASSSPASA
jgi:phosphatidylglycerol---prolipoprotein diacylglyceryl transferase